MATRKELMARLPSFIAGGNFSEGLSPTGNALKNTPVTDKPVASKPMGNITGVDKSVAPYRSGISRADEASSPSPTSFTDAVEGNFKMGEPTGNALSFTPVADRPTSSKPMGNASTAIQSNSVDEEKALKLFTKIHGKGGFDSRSPKDLAKMDAIKALMGQEGSDKMTPSQFAMKIYASQKRTK